MGWERMGKDGTALASMKETNEHSWLAATKHWTSCKSTVSHLWGFIIWAGNEKARKRRTGQIHLHLLRIPFVNYTHTTTVSSYLGEGFSSSRIVIEQTSIFSSASYHIITTSRIYELEQLHSIELPILLVKEPDPVRPIRLPATNILVPSLESPFAHNTAKTYITSTRRFSRKPPHDDDFMI